MGRPRTDPREILGIQTRKLRRLVSHAYRNVPYYRRLLDRSGVVPHDIQTPSDLARLPITTKNDLRAIPLEETVARGVRPERLPSVTTSGSSGEPFTIHRTWLENRIDALRWIRAVRHLGMQVTDRFATILYIRPVDRRDETFDKRALRALNVHRRLSLDCCDDPRKIIREFCAFRPAVIIGYPGTLALIADSMTDHDRRIVRPRGVLACGEVLTAAARRRIRTGFTAPVYNLYASRELGLIAWECADTGDLHVCDDGVLVEVLCDGRPARPGEEGELVATNLDASAVPFIRYRLGDLVTKGHEACPCGRPFSTLRRIEGRTVDHFPLPDGRLMHPYRIVRTVLQSAAWIRRYQLVHDRRSRVLLRVVPSHPPTEEEIRRLENAARPLLGPDVEFDVLLVPEIETGPGGKLKVLCSLVDRPQAEASAQRTLSGSLS